jgi:hypothetical protein
MRSSRSLEEVDVCPEEYRAGGFTAKVRPVSFRGELAGGEPLKDGGTPVTDEPLAQLPAVASIEDWKKRLDNNGSVRAAEAKQMREGLHLLSRVQKQAALLRLILSDTVEEPGGDDPDRDPLRRNRRRVGMPSTPGFPHERTAGRRGIIRAQPIHPRRDARKFFLPNLLTFFKKRAILLLNRAPNRVVKQAAMTPGPSGRSVEAGRT